MSDGIRKQWEPGIVSATYVSFLRELGSRVVTAPWWVHDDLRPSFPCRPLTRDQMPRPPLAFRKLTEHRGTSRRLRRTAGRDASPTGPSDSPLKFSLDCTPESRETEGCGQASLVQARSQ